MDVKPLSILSLVSFLFTSAVYGVCWLLYYVGNMRTPEDCFAHFTEEAGTQADVQIQYHQKLFPLTWSCSVKGYGRLDFVPPVVNPLIIILMLLTLVAVGFTVHSIIRSRRLERAYWAREAERNSDGGAAKA